MGRPEGRLRCQVWYFVFFSSGEAENLVVRAVEYCWNSWKTRLVVFHSFNGFHSRSEGWGVWGEGIASQPAEKRPSLRLFYGAPGRGRFLRYFVPPRFALVPLTDVRADTVSAGGSVSRPLPRFDTRNDASRLGLDLACGCRSEGLLGMPGGVWKKPLPKPLPHPKNGSWAILGPHFVGSRFNLLPAPEIRATRGRDRCMDLGGCLPAVFREHRVLRVVEKGPSPFFQERNPVKTSWIRDQIGVFSSDPL